MPGTYQITVLGHLPDRWSGSFGRLEISRQRDGTTRLTGPIVDQAELHAVLARVRDLGLTLVSVVRGEGAGEEEPGGAGGGGPGD